MFFEMSYQKGQCYLFGLNAERGANQTLTCSVEHAAMICDILLPLLRTAGWEGPSTVCPSMSHAL